MCGVVDIFGAVLGELPVLPGLTLNKRHPSAPPWRSRRRLLLLPRPGLTEWLQRHGGIVVPWSSAGLRARQSESELMRGVLEASKQARSRVCDSSRSPLAFIEVPFSFQVAQISVSEHRRLGPGMTGAWCGSREEGVLSSHISHLTRRTWTVC